MSGPRIRDGFALPVAILLLLVTTGAVMVTLSQGSAERRVQDTDIGVLEALALAETGLERFGTPNSTGWSWSNGYPIPTVASSAADLPTLGQELGLQGFAQVAVRRVWLQGSSADPDVALYSVSSRGVRTLGGWGGAPQASRVVSRLVRYERPEPLVAEEMFPSAWTSLSGLLKNGNSGDLTGYDAASPGLTNNGNACGNQPAKAGVAVPTNPGYSGHTGPVKGEPPILHIGDTPEDAAASIDLDWEKMIDGSTFPQELPNVFVIPHEGGWNDITDSEWDQWPIVFVDSDALDQPFDMPKGGGNGTLIVTGDATISGSNLWQGLVLIGGKLTSNGNNTVSGAVLSGLNVKLADQVGVGEVEAADVGNGTKTFEYHSCYLANAMEAINATPPPTVTVLANTWLDTWAQY